MNYTNRLKENSDSLIGLLAGQCADLEVLFDLAQRETAAAGQKDFETVFSIVTERARIGEKLETYQRQIAELRSFLAGSAICIRELFADNADQYARRANTRPGRADQASFKQRAGRNRARVKKSRDRKTQRERVFAGDAKRLEL